MYVYSDNIKVYDFNYEIESWKMDCSHGIQIICIFPYGNTNQSPQFQFPTTFCSTNLKSYLECFSFMEHSKK